MIDFLGSLLEMEPLRQNSGEADCKPSSVRVMARFTAGFAAFFPLPFALCDHPSVIAVARDL